MKDKEVRRPAQNSIKINPKRNFNIDNATFVNLENQEEFNSPATFKTPGGDSFKYVTFCQTPKTQGCNIATIEGNNRIEYKYWADHYEPCAADPQKSCKNGEILEEHETLPIHFTHLHTKSEKVCKRKPYKCPLEASPTWSECAY